jgi:hypothetical protein
MTPHVALCHCEELVPWGRTDEAISFRHSSELYETLYKVLHACSNVRVEISHLRTWLLDRIIPTTISVQLEFQSATMIPQAGPDYQENLRSLPYGNDRKKTDLSHYFGYSFSGSTRRQMSFPQCRHLPLRISASCFISAFSRTMGTEPKHLPQNTLERILRCAHSGISFQRFWASGVKRLFG